MKTKNIILIITISVIGLTLPCLMRLHGTPTLSSGTEGHRDIWYCAMHPHYTSDHPGQCPICGMDLIKKQAASSQEPPAKSAEKKILYWTDTMLPGYKSDHPGKSPMGMDLTPVYEKDAIAQDTKVAGYTAINETPQRQQLIGLRTEVVGVMPIVKVIRTVGTISSALQLYQIQNDFIDAYMAYVGVHRNYKRINDRKDTWGIHRDLQARLLEAQDKLFRLGLNQGDIDKLQNVSWNQVWKQPKLLLFNNTQEYWVMAQFFEQDLSFIKEGQEVQINVSAYHKKIKGTIRSVGGFIDPTSRSVTALIELGNFDGRLAANMQVDVIVPVKLTDALFVPRPAVMDTGLRKIVFVVSAADTFQPREIQTGLQTDDGFEVTAGLKMGDRIVVSGNFLLDSESRVQAGLDADTEVSMEGEGNGK